jgi:hypothetical protein
MTKLRRIRWAGYLACMGRSGMHIEFWWKSRKEGHHWEDLHVECSLILWRVDPLLGRDFEMDNEYSRCYAIGDKQTPVYK